MRRECVYNSREALCASSRVPYAMAIRASSAPKTVRDMSTLRTRSTMQWNVSEVELRLLRQDSARETRKIRQQNPYEEHTTQVTRVTLGPDYLVESVPRMQRE